jgi:hypothetical protein
MMFLSFGAVQPRRSGPSLSRGSAGSLQGGGTYRFTARSIGHVTRRCDLTDFTTRSAFFPSPGRSENPRIVRRSEGDLPGRSSRHRDRADRPVGASIEAHPSVWRNGSAVATPLANRMLRSDGSGRSRTTPVPCFTGIDPATYPVGVREPTRPHVAVTGCAEGAVGSHRISSPPRCPVVRTLRSVAGGRNRPNGGESGIG